MSPLPHSYRHISWPHVQQSEHEAYVLWYASSKLHAPIGQLLRRWQRSVCEHIWRSMHARHLGLIRARYLESQTACPNLRSLQTMWMFYRLIACSHTNEGISAGNLGNRSDATCVDTKRVRQKESLCRMTVWNLRPKRHWRAIHRLLNWLTSNADSVLIHLWSWCCQRVLYLFINIDPEAPENWTWRVLFEKVCAG